MCSTHCFNAEMVAAHAITHHHIKWCGCCAFFNISTHMEARRVRSSVNHFVDGSLIAMIGEHNRSFPRKALDKFAILHPMWMKVGRIEGHKINYVDNAHS